MDIFISYAREDTDFVQSLHRELAAREKQVWVDWEGIPITAEWLAEIYSAIEESNTFVFIISPDSISSETCQKELAHAIEHNKRLVPVVYRDIDTETVPATLARLNWLFFRDCQDVNEFIDSFLQVIDTDLDWVQSHTRLLTRAIEWERHHRDKSYLLRGKDLQDAEQWLTQGPLKEPHPTSLQTTYIVFSRKARTSLLGWVLTAVATALIVAVSLALIADAARKTAQSNLARTQYNWSRLRSEEYADPVEALLFAAAALETAPQNDPCLDVYVRRVEQLALAIPRRIKIDGPVSEAVFSRDVDMLATMSEGELRITDLLSGRATDVPTLTSGTKTSVARFTIPAFSPDGRFFAASSGLQTGQYWELATGRSESFPNPHIVPRGRVQSAFYFSPDSRTVLWWLGVETGDFDGQHVQAAYDLTTGEPRSTKAIDSTFRYGKIAWSRNPVRNWAVVLSDDVPDQPQLQVVDVATAAPVSKPFGPTPEEGVVHSIGLSPNAEWVVSSTYREGAGSHQLEVWRAEDGARADFPVGESPTRVLIQDITADGEKILTVSIDRANEGSLQLWKLREPSYPHACVELGSITNKESLWTRFWERERFAAFCGNDNLIMAVSSPNHVISAAASSTLTSQTDRHNIRLWDAGTGTELKSIRVPGELIAWDVAASGRELATASQDGTVQVWTPNWDQPNSLLHADAPLASEGPYHAAWFDAKQQSVITASPHGLRTIGGMPAGDRDAHLTLRAWTLKNGNSLWEDAVSIQGEYAYWPLLRFSRDGRRFATASLTGASFSERKTQLQVWDARTGKAISPNTVDVPGRIVDFSLDPNADTIVTARIETDYIKYGGPRHLLQEWDVATGTDLQTLPLEERPVLALSANGQHFLTGTGDQHYRRPSDWSSFWQLGVGKRAGRGALFRRVSLPKNAPTSAPVVASVLLSADELHMDGTDLIAAFPGVRIAIRDSAAGASLWNTVTRTRLATPDGAFDASFMPVVSPDGEWIATVAKNRREARVWSTRTGMASSEHILHEAEVLALSFSPACDRLLSITRNGIVRSLYIGATRSKKPAWCHGIGEALTGMRLMEGDAIQSLSEEQILQHRSAFFKRLQAAERAQDTGARLIYRRWKDKTHRVPD